MVTFSIKLSIIIPAYNEAEHIQATLREVDKYLRQQSYTSEIIVVVNGSHDNTYELAKQSAATLVTKIVVFNLAASGKGQAVRYGILNGAAGEFMMFMDADNATPISEIAKFWPYLEAGYEVVIGSRYISPKLVQHYQPWHRIILSRLSNTLIQLLLMPGIMDTQLGFKAFSRPAAEEIFSQVTVARWGFDMEVLTIAAARQYQIKELGVTWTEHGHSHLPLRAYAQSLSDLWKIKVNSLSGKYRSSKS
jgi:dolichyl-phosphate beta-glucosyltransferase